MKDFSAFEERIGVIFENKLLLQEAFTHRSFINENPNNKTGHNERLEFLGDAVLELAVTRFLFEKYPNVPEGILTAYRSSLVNTTSISEAATEMGAGEFLLLSKGESKDTGKARAHIMANLFEALTGAIYLDQGYDTAQKFIEKALFHKIEKIIAAAAYRDAKSSIQEKAQEILKVTPVYKVISESGPDHDKEFVMGIYFADELAGEGKGHSKQEAQQSAALNAMEKRGWK